MTRTNTPATVKRELTKDELEKLGRHAGHLAREIYLKQVARKDAADKAKLKIDELKAELSEVHEKLHNGFELIPAQMELITTDDDEEDDLEMPPTDNVTDLASRLDECRSVVQQAKEKTLKEDSEDEEYYRQAVELNAVQEVTVSVLRRRLKIGKGRASRIMDRLVDDGLVVGHV